MTSLKLNDSLLRIYLIFRKILFSQKLCYQSINAEEITTCRRRSSNDEPAFEANQKVNSKSQQYLLKTKEGKKN